VTLFIIARFIIVIRITIGITTPRYRHVSENEGSARRRAMDGSLFMGAALSQTGAD